MQHEAVTCPPPNSRQTKQLASEYCGALSSLRATHFPQGLVATITDKKVNISDSEYFYLNKYQVAGDGTPN